MANDVPAKGVRSPASIQRGVARRGVQVLMLVLFQAMVLFLAAGRLEWVWGWVYLGIYLVLAPINAIFLLRYSSETIADRAEARGMKGWDKVVWDVVATNDTPQGPTIKFTYLSKDGEEGYPGNVTATVTYALTNDNEFKVEMEATTDKTTLVNMAHHSYWNLGGYDSGSIADHELTLYADNYTPGNPFVPDGVIEPVKGTPFDFTTQKPIGKDMQAVKVKGNPNGYDQ